MALHKLELLRIELPWRVRFLESPHVPRAERIRGKDTGLSGLGLILPL